MLPDSGSLAHLVLEVPLRGLPDLLGLEVLLLDPRLLPAAALVEDPPDEVIDRLGRRDDVEGRRARPALLEVRDPQLGARELPLHVRLLRRDGYELGGRESAKSTINLTSDILLSFITKRSQSSQFLCFCRRIVGVAMILTSLWLFELTDQI